MPDSVLNPNAVSAHDLIAREQTIFQRELLNRATQVRFRLVVLALAVGVTDFAFNVLPGPRQFLVVDSILMLLVNELVRSWNRRGATNERHLWGMQVLDAIMFGLIVASFGHEGHLVIPFLVLAVAGYAMGHARAARLQLLLSCTLYPIAHLVGERMFSPSYSVVHILL